jgi:hypothetical protein
MREGRLFVMILSLGRYPSLLPIIKNTFGGLSVIRRIEIMPTGTGERLILQKGPVDMKLTLKTILFTLLCCLFAGIIIISIGFGAIYPPLDRVARPFLCPNGQMEYVTEEYNPSPVETVTTITWYCVDDQTGSRTELGIFPMSLYSGTIYGLLLFVPVLIGMVIYIKRNNELIQSLRDPGNAGMKDLMDRLGVNEQFHKTYAGQDQQDLAKLLNNSGSALARMKELKGLRDANLISEAEYEQKREEILKNL